MRTGLARGVRSVPIKARSKIGAKVDSVKVGVHIGLYTDISSLETPTSEVAGWSLIDAMMAWDGDGSGILCSWLTYRLRA